MARIINLIAALGLVLLATACAEIPQQELGTYVEAYGQARSATEQVLTDLIAAREEIKANQAAAAAAKAPVRRGVYVPPTERSGASGPDAIGSRLAALALVSQYNDILVAIAEGKRVAVLQAKVQGAAQVATELLSLAGASFPGVGALTGLLQTIASEAQKYKDRKDFADAVRAGAPLVKDILQFFIQDTPLIVAVHEGVWDAEGAPLRNQADRIARSIFAEVRQSAPPPAGSPEQKKLGAIESHLTEELSKIRPGAVTLQPAGRTPLTMATLEGMDADLGSLDMAVAAYLENQRKSPALRALMDKYVDTLAATQAALDNVAKALDRPVDISKAAIELLDSAIAIKQQYAIYKAAVKSP